ncbi:3-phosphoshikimate 1-carboxyvinyltransferase [Capsulimonas corticalis]|uniref:3-phosphoshikimate 1-carboxyvinyltransferase n=1 Tax=Capsulimonas corticalis TaxID=2219043 RepID=A0A402CX74_9BACT|nr:3-phosphoshikimate 1-carboxyvinyltransferase [Capsulimonas corticalis]BDI32416.1 3-phosphoshikimate 1-carboxyvinyltransferase [Capsulimonas corticalis]
MTPVDGPVHSAVRLPGSKSITNRALLLAALADGKSVLRDPLQSDDTLYMFEALRSLGVDVTLTDAGDFEVIGVGGAFSAPAKSPIFIGNSGTTVRFLTAAACLAPAGSDVVLDGVARMRERPIRDLLGALISLGVDAESVNGHGCPPVRVRGGGLPGGKCLLRGDVSSQFLTALLQAAPYAKQNVEIEIVGDLISKPYVDMTQNVMHAFGVEMVNSNYRHLTVAAGQRYEGREYDVEADASNATYFLAAAAVTGGSVILENLGAGSIQGDAKFARVLEQMGCDVDFGVHIAVRGPQTLKAIDVDLEAIPDTAQTLAVIAAFADGPSTLRGLASLRVKETDRIAAITNELTKLGVGVEEGRDFWTITPPAAGQYQPAEIKTYDDHRMAMSFAVAGLRLPGVTILDPGCVAKTFPDFWERWEKFFYTAKQQ